MRQAPSPSPLCAPPAHCRLLYWWIKLSFARAAEGAWEAQAPGAIPLTGGSPLACYLMMTGSLTPHQKPSTAAIPLTSACTLCCLAAAADTLANVKQPQAATGAHARHGYASGTTQASPLRSASSNPSPELVLALC